MEVAAVVVAVEPGGSLSTTTCTAWKPTTSKISGLNFFKKWSSIISYKKYIIAFAKKENANDKC